MSLTEPAIPSEIERRKSDHITVVLDGRGAQATLTTGFERVRFVHAALPELDFLDIDLSTRFLGRTLSAPLLISSMTGGPARASAINARLAEGARALGIALAVGSQRVAIEEGAAGGLDRALRDRLGPMPLLANLGAAQLNLGYGRDQAMRAVEMIGADALILHLNPLQEVLQPEGDRNWAGLLGRIAALTQTLPVPLVVKEIGAGLSAPICRQLQEAGVSILDVAGAGGTSWAAVEAERAHSAEARAMALTFADWGIPTARAIADARDACPGATIIGSGGVRNGLDAAKALRLGADLAGVAAGFLEAATRSTEAVIAVGERLKQEMAITCFCTGSRDVAALKSAALLD
jgi:isopentenyl-diphosphate delta-isomerase